MSENFYQQKEDFFNLWASFYDCPLTTIFYQAVHQRLLEYVELEENATILDLGCGTGKLMNRLAAKFPTIKAIGMDLSAQMLREAREGTRYPERLVFVQGRAENLSFSNEQFNVVFCTMSFLHYPDPEKVFQQVKGVLAPGGHFYLVDAYRGENNYSSLLPWIGELRLYSQQQRQRLAAAAGLSAIAHHHLLPGILLTIFA
ncbi:MAG: methyltransferase domain-containing protein [Cyanobacteria bacterium J06621_8]